MIKFKALIHKETGTVIEYKELVGYLEREKPSMKIIPKGSEKGYFPRDMLFSDDFKIIYDSEFSQEELTTIFNGYQKENNELMKKIHKSVYDKEFLKLKYGIEV